MSDHERWRTAPAEILVVDDIPANLKLLTDILRDRGYRVRPASSGQLALRSVATRLPDLILLDVMMPDMNGYEVCRHLKSDENSHNVPVIFISALHEIGDKVKGFDAGGVDYITKPFEAAEVLARVETHLTLRSLQKQLETQNTRLQLEIVERRQAEEALKRSENTYRTIFENTGTALVIVEENSLISLTNTRFVILSGYCRDEIENKKKWAEFVHEDDLERIKNYHITRRVDPYAVPAHYEFRFMDRQDNIKNIIANVAMIPETGKNVASLMDITELRKMEAEIQRSRKHESIGILAGGIAHDFNNLLAIILGNISLAEMCAGEPESEIQKSLQIAEKTCLQAKSLTELLISLTRGQNPDRSPQSIRGLIAGAVDAVLRDSDVRCDLDLIEDLWPIDCDPTQIRQMITNLVANAKEAMKEGGTIEISATNEHLAAGSILSLKEGKYIRLSIKDHGAGIEEEHLFRIFDPYFSTKERGSKKGMGLGLATAYAIVKRHCGHIGLESRVGDGTTFFVYLPAFEKTT